MTMTMNIVPTAVQYLKQNQPNLVNMRQGMLRVVEGNTEVQDWEVDRVVLGHYQEVWGLAAHPTRYME